MAFFMGLGGVFVTQNGFWGTVINRSLSCSSCPHEEAFWPLAPIQEHISLKLLTLATPTPTPTPTPCLKTLTFNFCVNYGRNIFNPTQQNKGSRGPKRARLTEN